MAQTFTPQDVEKISHLATIPLQESELQPLADGFSQTIAVVEELNLVDTEGIEPIHHTTGLEHVTRPDVVDTERMFTQAQALANAPLTYQGYIVVDQLIDQE